MTILTVSLEDMNARVEALLIGEGYQVQPRLFQSAGREGRVAENPYFAVAFQPYETWSELTESFRNVEFEFGSAMQRGSSKNWDAYLLLACQERIYRSEQFDELVGIEYDTRRMRKLVAWGVGESLTRVDHLLRPFIALERIHAQAQTRDPLGALETRVAARSKDGGALIRRAVALFRQGKSLDVL